MGPLTARIEVDVRPPLHGAALLEFFGRHAVPGVETYAERPAGPGAAGQLTFARSVRLPHGPATLVLGWTSTRAGLEVRLPGADPRDLEAARRLVVAMADLDRETGPVEAWLGRDPGLRPLVAAAPGLRVPGAADVHEQLFRTMIGQQISLAGAAACAGKLAARYGEPFAGPPGIQRLFPTAVALAEADPDTLGMPRARGRAVVAVARALAGGDLVLDAGTDPAEARAALLAQPGVGPWTADYVLMRALRVPDVLLTSDLVIKRELQRRGLTDTARWAPWRSYATLHLWRAWTG